MHESKVTRKTNETDIEVKPSLEGSCNTDISTGIAFFDHMLNFFAKYGSFDLTVKARGDPSVKDRHMVEDAGITLGSVLAKALGDKKGIEHFGKARVPMDEALASTAVDIDGRRYLVFTAILVRRKLTSSISSIETVTLFRKPF